MFYILYNDKSYKPFSLLDLCNSRMTAIGTVQPVILSKQMLIPRVSGDMLGIEFGGKCLNPNETLDRAKDNHFLFLRSVKLSSDLGALDFKDL